MQQSTKKNYKSKIIKITAATAITLSSLASLPYNLMTTEAMMASAAELTKSVDVATFAQFKTALEDATVTDIQLKNSLTLTASITTTKGAIKNIHGNGNLIDLKGYKVLLADGASGLVENATITSASGNNYSLFYSENTSTKLVYRDINQSGGYLPRMAGELRLEGNITHSTTGGNNSFEGRNLTIASGANVQFTNPTSGAYSSIDMNATYGPSTLLIEKGGYLNIDTAATTWSGIWLYQGSNMIVDGTLDLKTKLHGINVQKGAESATITVSGEMNIDSQDKAILGDISKLEFLEGSKSKISSASTTWPLTIGTMILRDNSDVEIEATSTAGSHSAVTLSQKQNTQGFTAEPKANFSITTNNGKTAIDGYSTSQAVKIQSATGITTWTASDLKLNAPGTPYNGPFTASYQVLSQVKSNLTSNNADFQNNFDTKTASKIASGSYSVLTKDVETLDQAKKAVNDLFKGSNPINDITDTLTQAEIDNAKTLVNKVTDQTQKDALNKDIVKAQQQLDQKNAAIQAEKDKQDAATKAVKELFTNDDPATDTIKDATNQTAIDNAQKAIDLLAAGPIKTEMQKDLNRAQELLNQKNAEEAEKAKQDAANKAVKELFTNDDPATDAIKTTTDQTAINNAQNAIDSVTDEPTKAAMQKDLDRAQELLDQKNAAQTEKEKQDAATKVVKELFTNDDPATDAIKDITKQTTIDNAQKAINLLAEGPLKVSLQKDLDRAQELLDARQAAADAELKQQGAAKYAVNQLFQNNSPATDIIKDTTTQARIDDAQEQIDLVTNTDVKKALQKDLDRAQELLNAKQAAEKAVNELFTNNSPAGDTIKDTTNQAAIDKAQELIQGLPDGDSKTALQKDLDRAQELLDQKTATQAEQAKKDAADKAVKELFINDTPASDAIKDTTKQQAIDNAQKAIDLLVDGPAKTAMQKDLDRAQELLDARQAAADAELKQQGAATYAVEQLFQDNSPITDVIKDTTTQAKIDDAQKQIDLVKTEDVKKELQKDLDRAQELLDMKKAVNELFTNDDPTSGKIKDTVDQAAIDKVQDLINILPDGDMKTALQSDLDRAQELLDQKTATQAEKEKQDAATKAVKELFTSNDPTTNAIKDPTNQAAIDKAQDAINTLADGTVKTALQKDLDKAQELLDQRNAAQTEQQKQDAANQAVKELFTNNDPASDTIKDTTKQQSIDNAQKTIDILAEGPTKVALQKELDRAQELLDARQAAEEAELRQQGAAKYAVNQLFQNNTPASDAIKDTTTQAKIDDAQAEINAVKDATIKAALQKDLDRAQELLNAKQAGDKAIQDAAEKAVKELFSNDNPASNAIKDTTNQAAIDSARAAVQKVTDPAKKAALTADLDKAQNLLDAKKAAQDAADKAVNELFNNNNPANTIKDATNQKAIDDAKTAIEKVTDADKKAALQKDLDKAQQQLNDRNTIILAIPQLNPMTEADTVFSGKLDVSQYNPGTIRIYINNAPATVVAVDANGNFSYNIGNRKAGDVIGVDYKDRTGQYNANTKTSITVTPITSNVTINKMTENDDTVTGKVAPNAKVRYVVNGQAVNVGYADANGNYSMYIGKQKVGTVVGVEVFDPATNKYKAAVTTTVLAVNVTIQPMTNANDTVTGTAPANAKLRFLINGVAVNVGTADASGNYSKYVGTQLVGTMVAVEMLNPETGKYELAKTITVTGAPKSTEYTVNELTTDGDTLTGKAPAGAKLRFSINGNLVSVITADASGNYSKFIGKQKAGAVVSVELLNENTNQYTAPKSVTVTTGTGNATLAPVINTITEGQGVVTGTVPTSIVQVRVWVNDVAQTMVSATNGNFTWTKANLKAGDTVKVDYKDATGTWISAEKVVTK
ncbi:hypothetical protein BMT55_09015 [Listeria newyorkensis]|uniref:Pesticidal crystal protein Cry1Aa domain-containing protein n=2 Tax=Listeria newyorkensis TaxID=1497681 RepID=A0ABX4XMP0_9LIST|nr:toxin Cry1Ac domain D-VI-related protein [Listeria newyorkensis]KGL37442.1 hypothetical protein EP58_16940 [Listeria newyorkensis]PNP92101.1 hypothetical protein BMT55_09015 [Listeria newyorkensis]SQC54809.1 Uncharacterised protein [Listeria newyorkensis]